MSSKKLIAIRVELVQKVQNQTPNIYGIRRFYDDGSSEFNDMPNQNLEQIENLARKEADSNNCELKPAVY